MLVCERKSEEGQCESGGKDGNAVGTSSPARAESNDDGRSISSPLRKIDPVVRALNTIMYGLVVHFGTLWMIELSRGGDEDDAADYDHADDGHPGYLLAILFLHEYWVYLQHSNVLGNPLLQHLDRQYGIALLKSNRHWSIAGTLSAYWARETLGMFLCLPFLQSSHGGSFARTQYLILYSIVYHTVKSRGIRRDALERSSSRFGIMRLVIDKFYVHSAAELYTTARRLALQGLDTFIHFCIVRDLVLSSGSSPSRGWFVPSMHALFGIWVVHAALNQLFRCSTASVMVRAWHSLATRGSGAGRRGDGDREKAAKETPGEDASTEGESVSSGDEASSSDGGGDRRPDRDGGGDEDFVVRRLLHPDRVDDSLRGRQGAASSGVDTAVRLETAIAILASFFMLGLGEVPLQILSPTFDGSCVHDQQGIISLSLYAWLLWSLLHGIWSMFLRSRSLQRSMRALNLRHASSAANRRRSLVHMLDLAVVIGIATGMVSPERRWRMLPACVFFTAKAFLQSAQVEYPKLVWKGLIAIEFALKLAVLKMVTGIVPDDSTTMVSSALAIVWAVWVVSSPVPTPCEVGQSRRREDPRDDATDVVFLGHPARLADLWALWLLPYSLKERWRPPFWAELLWPFHYLVGYFMCSHQRKLFGDGASFFRCDDVRYGRQRMQCWVSPHFGRHFVTNPREVRGNIEAAARHAEAVGARVLCLGALNKAESINGGGAGLVRALGPGRRLSVVHGNHLTAAAVVETIRRCYGERRTRFFLTGASSKVGWAVARALRDRHGHEVLCHSTDPGRRAYFEARGFRSARTLAEGAAFGGRWIVGKFDMDVARHIPQNATAVVFSVPHPLESRPDVRVIEAGTLRIDMSRLDRPRVFTNKLREDEVFACHAAGVVAAHRLDRRGVSRIDEVGPVDPDRMDGWLADAEKLGFLVPRCEPVPEEDLGIPPVDRPPVVVVGGGPSGLAVAAHLSRRRVPHVLLEAEEDPNAFGSWGRHFKGLEVTTQKKWCNLPGFPMGEKEYPNETVTAEEYQRYLRQYAHRYAINIRRGVTVKSIRKGTGQAPYVVKFHENEEKKEGKLHENEEKKEDKPTELAAWSVVIATGKNRIPQKNTSDDIAGKLESCGIPHVHSTEMRDDATWVQAIQAARNGRLCIVGFGNSAADLATGILQHCPAGADDGDETTRIHVSARTIPPVFPRRVKFLRVDTLGYLVRRLPNILQELLVKTVWWGIPDSSQCDAAFPPHLRRWNEILGRVPVIDKHGTLASGFRSGRLVGHGPISAVAEGREMRFADRPTTGDHDIIPASTPGTRIDMAILATGYREECVVDREDRLNGLYKCGFGNSDRFLPLLSISEDAECIAEDIAASYCHAPRT